MGFTNLMPSNESPRKKLDPYLLEERMLKFQCVERGKTNGQQISMKQVHFMREVAVFISYDQREYLAQKIMVRP